MNHKLEYNQHRKMWSAMFWNKHTEEWCVAYGPFTHPSSAYGMMKGLVDYNANVA